MNFVLTANKNMFRLYYPNSLNNISKTQSFTFFFFLFSTIANNNNKNLLIKWVGDCKGKKLVKRVINFSHPAVWFVSILLNKVLLKN